VTARAVDRLADRFGHFVRLAGRDADFALPVANRDERVEREAAATLHDFRDAVDGDDVLDQIALAVAAIPATVVTTATIAATSLGATLATLTASVATGTAGTTTAALATAATTALATALPATSATTAGVPAAITALILRILSH
jgi:hypothetical protein